MIRKVQKSVYDTLTANSSLTTLLAAHLEFTGEPAIYDRVLQPVDAANDDLYPFVRIGNITGNDKSAFGANSIMTGFTIHTFSRYRGKSEIHNIQDEIYNSLHRVKLTDTGGSYFDGMDIFLDDDMITQHGVQKFRILGND